MKDDNISDHYIVVCDIKASVRKHPKSAVHVRKLSKIDKEDFTTDLSSALETALRDTDPIDYATVYNHTATKVLDVHAPVLKINRKQAPYKPWYSDDIHDARRKRRQFERKLRKSPTEIKRQLFLDQRREVVTMIERAKKAYYKEKLAEASSRETFEVVNELLNPGVCRPFPSSVNPQSLANNFVSYFSSKVQKIRADLDNTPVDKSLLHGCNNKPSPPVLDSLHEITTEEVIKTIQHSPTKSCGLDPLPTRLLKDPTIIDGVAQHLTSIVNTSLTSATVPPCFKQATITPLLKKQGLDVEDMKNYRPVSNLAFLGKVLERVVAKQLLEHMSINDLHDPLQSAYKPRHSTETVLLTIKNDIDSALDRGQGVLLLLLDLSAAFDALDHKVLLTRLSTEVGIRGKALEWFSSYLSSRKQCVTINGASSNPSDLTIGVPQGSVLGPLLFLVYVLPLRRIIESFNVQRHGYADYSQLYNYFTLSANAGGIPLAVEQLEKCAAAVQAWMINNKLKIND